MKAVLHINRSERRKVRLLHDNPRAHTAKVLMQKLEELGWETLAHPPYWPDLAPSGYHLFRLLRSQLVTKRLDDEADLKPNLDVFFSSLSKVFFENGVVNLPKTWEYVIDNNGVDVID